MKKFLAFLSSFLFFASFLLTIIGLSLSLYLFAVNLPNLSTPEDIQMFWSLIFIGFIFRIISKIMTKISVTYAVQPLVYYLLLMAIVHINSVTIMNSAGLIISTIFIVYDMITTYKQFGLIKLKFSN